MSKSDRAVLTDEELEIVSGGGLVDPSNPTPWCGAPRPVSGGGLGEPADPVLRCGTHPHVVLH